VLAVVHAFLDGIDIIAVGLILAPVVGNALIAAFWVNIISRYVLFLKILSARRVHGIVQRANTGGIVLVLSLLVHVNYVQTVVWVIGDQDVTMPVLGVVEHVHVVLAVTIQPVVV
jgi:hypothetical protein